VGLLRRRREEEEEREEEKEEHSVHLARTAATIYQKTYSATLSKTCTAAATT
jgi:hypothetical protein